MLEKSLTSIEKAVSLILSAEYDVALTGAGVSVESGIPPFRGHARAMEKLKLNEFR